jgi:hypothetical protein
MAAYGFCWAVAAGVVGAAVRNPTWALGLLISFATVLFIGAVAVRLVR